MPIAGPTLTTVKEMAPPSRSRPQRLDGGREREVVTRARAGDKRAFASLMERYGQPVLSLCYASTLDPADAEDLAQDVFLAAWRGLPRFRGESGFSTWLFTLTRNACVDRARRAATRPRLATEREQQDIAALGDDGEPRRTAHAILDAAAGLTPPLRQALLLRDVQGFSYDEIAAVQDVPIGTVRSRISAARRAVADALSGP